jgi:hypothetical protein
MAHIPEDSVCLERPATYPFKDNTSGSVQERPICQVRVPGDPTAVSRAPEQKQVIKVSLLLLTAKIMNVHETTYAILLC